MKIKHEFYRVNIAQVKPFIDAAIQRGDKIMMPDNIEVFDANENLLWTAEPPQSRMDFYYDMKIDSVNKVLLAYTAVSHLARIDLETGKTLDFQMIKQRHLVEK